MTAQKPEDEKYKLNIMLTKESLKKLEAEKFEDRKQQKAYEKFFSEFKKASVEDANFEEADFVKVIDQATNQLGQSVSEKVADDFKQLILQHTEPVLIGSIYKIADYTLYLKREKGEAFERLLESFSENKKHSYRFEGEMQPAALKFKGFSRTFHLEGDMQDNKGKKKYSYDGRMKLIDAVRDDKGEVIKVQGKPLPLFETARVLVCLCHEGEYWSITIRKGETPNIIKESLRTSLPPKAPLRIEAPNLFNEAPGKRAKLSEIKQDLKQREAEIKQDLKKKMNEEGEKEVEIKLKYEPRDSLDTENQKKFLNAISHICDPLYKEIFEKLPTPTGLVVIAGRTASAKSQIIRGVIYRYWENMLEEITKHSAQRNPHLLTFEDPIENFFWELKIGIESKKEPPDEMQQYAIDCTHRAKGKDAEDLEEVLNDALRQTPAMVFIGETRHKEDWRVLLEFAGTGHLVFTTAHAGSLTETMGKIFEATEATTPAQRAVIADRLLAVVHIKNGKIENDGRTILVPALWRRTTSGAKALMAEGRASLLPNNPQNSNSSAQKKETPYTIGRRWFAGELVKKAVYKALQDFAALTWSREPLGRTQSLFSIILMCHLYKRTLKREVEKLAIKWDMEGI